MTLPTMVVSVFKPFKPNGISHFYQMDQTISVLRIIGCVFVLFKFNRKFCKQTLETLNACSSASDLVLHYLPIPL